MRVLLHILTIVAFLFLNACQNGLINDTKVTEELLNKFHGQSGSLYYVEDKLAKNEEKVHFIRFIINGSEIAFKEERKTLYAPTIAIDLFNRLSKKTIANNYAIEIIFDKSDTDYNKYFYTMKDLEIVNHNIEKLKVILDSRENSNPATYAIYFDTTSCKQNIDSTLLKLRYTYQQVDKSKTLFSYYKYFNHYEIFIIFSDYQSNSYSVSVACSLNKKERSILGIFF